MRCRTSLKCFDAGLKGKKEASIASSAILEGQGSTFTVSSSRRLVMSTKNWIVKTLGGEEWGFVKRLVLDSVTRQISHADVILSETGQLIRIPWESFEVRDEGIILSKPEGQVNANAIRPSGVGLADAVAIEVWP
jgi:hypothetical protein